MPILRAVDLALNAGGHLLRFVHRVMVGTLGARTRGLMAAAVIAAAFVPTPAFAQFEAGPRNEAFAKLVPRAMWWFRWGAMSTLAFGLLLFGLYSGNNNPYHPMSAINANRLFILAIPL